MTVGSILQNALSALQTNQAALNTTSSNIANVNTPGYKRRIVELQPQVVGSTEGGVEIADIARASATFLADQALNVASDTARYTTTSNIHDSIQSMFGSPNDNTSLPGQLDALFSSITDLQTDPGSIIKRNATLTQLGNVARGYADTATQIQALRVNADQQVQATVQQINALLQTINGLNPQIQQAVVTGGDANGLKDQRDQAVTQLASLMDIRTNEQANGKLFVTTKDGVPLVTDQIYQLSYASTGNVNATVNFSPITVQRLDIISGQLVPPVTNLGPHLGSGALRGLLDMRDQTLPALADQVGELAGQVADALNAVHNANTTVPPPASMTGRNTGLLGTDTANFTGKTTFAVVDTTGALVSRVDVDFSAGTVTVDGTPSAGFAGPGDTIDNMVNAINTGLGANGSIAFNNGVMTLQASGAGNGIAMLDDPTTPSARGGHGFSQAFGLNDIFTAARPANFDTGLQASDASGFAAGQTIKLDLVGPNGQTAASLNYTMTGGTIGQIISDLNTAGTGLGGFVNFNLDANGKLAATPTAAFPGYKLEISADFTNRGGTGVSFSQLFNFGMGAQAQQAQSMKLTDTLQNNPAALATAKLALTSTSVAGNNVLGTGDNSGALALASVQSRQIAFNNAGGMNAVNATLGNFAGNILANSGAQAAQSDTLRDQNESLQTDLAQRTGAVEGVNLDEELANMLMYQKSYNAAARLINTASQVFDALLQVVQ